jgi:hypothetical protein
MSDWLDHFAEAFVKQSNARTTVMGSRAEKAGMGSAMARSSGPTGIAPTPKPVRNPQTRATTTAPKAQPPSISSAVTLPKSFPAPKPPQLKVSFAAAAKPVMAAFFRGVRGIPGAAWRVTPKSVKVLGGAGLGGVGAYKAGKGLYGHFSEESQQRQARQPARVRQQQLSNTFRYGSGTASSSF